jgi:hypothetical protein
MLLLHLCEGQELFVAGMELNEEGKRQSSSVQEGHTEEEAHLCLWMLPLLRRVEDAFEVTMFHVLRRDAE